MYILFYFQVWVIKLWAMYFLDWVSSGMLICNGWPQYIHNQVFFCSRFRYTVLFCAFSKMSDFSDFPNGQVVGAHLFLVSVTIITYVIEVFSSYILEGHGYQLNTRKKVFAKYNSGWKVKLSEIDCMMFKHNVVPKKKDNSN